jgi:hypothetical protein
LPDALVCEQLSEPQPKSKPAAGGGVPAVRITSLPLTTNQYTEKAASAALPASWTNELLTIERL